MVIDPLHSLVTDLYLIPCLEVKGLKPEKVLSPNPIQLLVPKQNLGRIQAPSSQKRYRATLLQK